MSTAVTILATGTRIEECPPPAAPGSPEQRADLAKAAAGELVFVRTTAFVEFDAGHGVERWEGTPQGPRPAPLGESASTGLLDVVENDPGYLLADFGIAGMAASPFDWAGTGAAAHRGRSRARRAPRARLATS